ncbi:MAG: LON peptidase substrate-binding domain-containing protein [Phycisphaerales bacterium]|nr:LON peptidase substrate-binding domain-containing protein [Phycisphaerales bacterium]
MIELKQLHKSVVARGNNRSIILIVTKSININFSQGFPVFPLPGTILLPHAIQHLHVSEPAHCDLIDSCFETDGQLAIACFSPDPISMYAETPNIRPAVCIGQIIQHQTTDEGTRDVLLHGICRAQINTLMEPSANRTFCTADLSPLEEIDSFPSPMSDVRDRLRELLTRHGLSQLKSTQAIVDWFDKEEVTTHALLELIGFSMIRDLEVRYELLAEASPKRRANLISTELLHLDQLIAGALNQPWKQWPKGISWN